MGCGVVERHLEMAQPTTKKLASFTQSNDGYPISLKKNQLFLKFKYVCKPTELIEVTEVKIIIGIFVNKFS